ncbi:phosphoenolpyruvate mutase [Tessaracoccus aquimaris]|uniref:phosphoenolpyruvate mutase n=1 Tax=Tessaracoccus aquimaris TaxID=1332264 RepID=A0A1Q2CJB7_9ACTN|nr:phosphoenolpyruvate mutase [Tessaracoccus aquimaris]AQP46226.1 phosphoenolpyruvate mutase [Tessaracoccus aquimaris]
MSESKSVYIAISSDILHRGHLRIIEAGAELGEVTVGLLTDRAIATYKRLPVLGWESRVALVSSMRSVARVVEQDSLSYADNLRQLRPDYVVHGDDWRTGKQSLVRAEVLSVLAEYGGELVEVPYTSGVSGTEVERGLRPLMNTADRRRGKLRQLLALKPFLRVMEVSNGLSALIVENVHTEDPEEIAPREYDAMWVSSLCDSSFKGKPDIELVDFTSRMNTIHEIMEVSSKPIIVDGDTGGRIEHFSYTVRTLERAGVSAVIIEDKTGLKQNSLFGTDAVQTLDDPEAFAAKILAGKRAQVSRDFMIFARLESLIAGAGIEDALSRASVYLAAGADGIMIHSKEKDGSEIREFLAQFRAGHPDVPVVVVPTTYNHIHEDELSEMGANIIIHANHLLRSAYPAMFNTAKKILECGRSKEVDDEIMPIKDVLKLIPE